MREALGVRSCRRRSDAAAEQQPPRHLLFAALLEPLCLSCAHKHTSCSSPLLSTRILSTRLDSTACRAHCERLPSGLPPHLLVASYRIADRQQRENGHFKVIICCLRAPANDLIRSAVNSAVISVSRWNLPVFYGYTTFVPSLRIQLQLLHCRPDRFAVQCSEVK